MIAFLRGEVAAVLPPHQIYLDVQGVGYRILMAERVLSKLKNGQELTVLTYMNVSDNGIALYGFSTEEEKALFEQLLTVTGVGPKMALAALSTFEPAQLVDAVAAQDVTLVSRIPGVGKKTAQRIILELKGSIEATVHSLFENSNTASPAVLAQTQATEALLAMGFTSAEAEVALKGAPQDSTESALLQYALKRLGSL